MIFDHIILMLEMLRRINDDKIIFSLVVRDCDRCQKIKNYYSQNLLYIPKIVTKVETKTYILYENNFSRC